VRVLLTGGTGYLGKNVARSLAAHGHSLRLLVRENSDRRGLPASAELATGDVTDAASVVRAAEGCQAILHLAALVKVWVPDEELFEAINVGGLRNALAAARHRGARLVYTSSFIAMGPSGPQPVDEARVPSRPALLNPYQRTKARAAALAQEAAASGEDVVVLHPGVVYGPGDLTDGNLVARMVMDHLAGRLPGLIGRGDRLWSYAYVDDVAEGHVLALEKGRSGERYVLGGENATLAQLFALVAEATGVPPPRRHIPYAVATALGRLLWLWAELTGAPPAFTHGEVGVFREHWAYSSAKAERELGYRSRPLREGVAALLAWLGPTAPGPARAASVQPT
jgi:NAD+-dependent farnesol dehydrogenase